MVRRQPPSLAAEIPLTTLFPGAAQWGWYPWVCVKLNEVFLLGPKAASLLLSPYWNRNAATDPISDSDQSIATQKTSGVRSSGFLYLRLAETQHDALSSLNLGFSFHKVSTSVNKGLGAP